MKKNRYEIQTIDAVGLKEVACPYCGFANELPPRTLGLKELRKMQDGDTRIPHGQRPETMVWIMHY
jgi:hypothetical protein